MCSANVMSSSELLSSALVGAGAAFGALAGTFPLGCRLRFVGCVDTSDSIASRSCVFASVSCLASTHFLRWCLAGAALLQSCCKVQSSVHGQPIFSIDTRSSTSAVQSSYWTLNVCSPWSCPAAARAAWSPGSMHTSWLGYIVMVAALQSRLAQYTAHKPISHAPLSTCSTATVNCFTIQIAIQIGSISRRKNRGSQKD